MPVETFKIAPPAAHVTRLPPYLFVRLKALKAEVEKRGKDVIDLGMGNPDRPTPPAVVAALANAVRKDKSTHRYPAANGLPEFRRSIAKFYRRRFGVKLDPDTEVLPLVGSKEGLAHLCAAYLAPGDVALVPSPCYPVHYYGPLLVGARPALMPLEERNLFLPDIPKIPRDAAAKARFMILNYPNNPTAGVVHGLDLFREASQFAQRQGMFVVHDAAYSELCFDGYVAPSFLELPDAKSHAVEFHSLSKTYNMAGWRVGFAVGNPEIIATLGKFKSFLDYGVPGFIQQAAIEALDGSQESVKKLSELYAKRRDALCDALEAVGWRVRRPKASMYLWATLPVKLESMPFAERLIQEEGVVVAPGVGFGPHGEGYVRFALVDEVPRLQEAARRISRFLRKN